MLKYAVIFLLLVNVSLCHSACCEQEVLAKSLLDTATDLISKAKLNMPSCSGNEVKEVCLKENFDCADLYRSGHNESGIYNITPMNRLFYKKHLQVYCDMETDGGGWTVIQKRGNFGSPEDYFYQDWESYKNGFGSLEKDFWIGNEKIFALTNQKLYSIRFDMVHTNETRLYAKYNSFWIDNEFNNYTLHLSGYSGNIRDSMAYHNGRPFSTKDKGNAWSGSENCAISWNAGWWFNDIICFSVNFNGKYTRLSWADQSNHYLVSTEMKMRPANFETDSASANLNSFTQGSVE